MEFDLMDRARELIARRELGELSGLLEQLDDQDVLRALIHGDAQAATVMWRLLRKDRALNLFERLPIADQAILIAELGDAGVREVFAHLDPDDRVELLDELPAGVATKLLGTLDADEQDQTALILGYPNGSIGRRMTTDLVACLAHETVGQVIERIRKAPEAESWETVFVLESGRHLIGQVSLRDLLTHADNDPIKPLIRRTDSVQATADAEATARLTLTLRQLVLPIVDSEDRLVGIFTIDDAARLVAQEADEDHARAGAVEVLPRSYLRTSVRSVARSRVVWLLILALSAILTVNVLQIFEDSLAQVVTLALFIPLLTGIGGNTGSQAATTITRALATNQLRTRDIWVVAFKELRTGLLLGAMLGGLGFVIASLFFDFQIGTVIGLTIISICTLAATVGGVMPLLAKRAGVDPAVVSTPFISTFCDASGLLIYFGIAGIVLGI